MTRISTSIANSWWPAAKRRLAALAQRHNRQARARRVSQAAAAAAAAQLAASPSLAAAAAAQAAQAAATAASAAAAATVARATRVPEQQPRGSRVSLCVACTVSTCSNRLKSAAHSIKVCTRAWECLTATAGLTTARSQVLRSAAVAADMHGVLSGHGTRTTPALRVRMWRPEQCPKLQVASLPCYSHRRAAWCARQCCCQLSTASFASNPVKSAVLPTCAAEGPRGAGPRRAVRDPGPAARHAATGLW